MIALMQAQARVDDRIAIFRQMGTRFHESDPDLWWKLTVFVMLMLVAVLLVCVLYRLQNRGQQQNVSPQPMRLYLSLLRRLHLPWPEMWHLWRLADRLQLEHPAVLLISPVLFDKAVADDCSDEQGRIVHEARRQRLLAIRPILFGEAPPAPQ